MVHVDWASGSNDRIRLATNLAERFGAVLMGVAGSVPGRVPGGWFEAELEKSEDRIERVSAVLNRLAERFRADAGATAQPVEWRGRFTFPAWLCLNCAARNDDRRRAATGVGNVWDKTANSN